MLFLVCDLETTGLDPIRNQILEMYCIYWDTKTDNESRFHRVIRYDELVGHPKALAMNHSLTERIANDGLLFNLSDCSEHFHDFYNTLYPSPPTLVSKNTAFETGFLKSHFPWIKLDFRMIDPTSCFLLKQDDRPPGLATCMERAGIKSLEPRHTAKADCENLFNLLKGIVK